MAAQYLDMFVGYRAFVPGRPPVRVRFTKFGRAAGREFVLAFGKRPDATRLLSGRLIIFD
ncbi:hypothetical protein ASF00_09235 [Sphingomonas sp. Leaf34]|nr:hypothetical protein ASF00_09235 [Sphingomonas sp. Leaf34]